MLQIKKAQAATELVVLGTLVIVAFAFLINYSEKLNRQQANIQQTFRAALKESRGTNNSASYTKVVFRRMANVATPMELGQLQNFSSSANVLWADGTNTSDPTSKYKLNDAAAISIPYRENPAEGTVEESHSSFMNTVKSTTTFTKQQSGGNIVTTKTLDAKDTLNAKIDISGHEYSFTHELGPGGRYH